MSEKQEDKRRRQEEQALALRQQQWAGQDPALIERWAGGVPAGFDFRVPGYNELDPESGLMNDAMNWVPGRVMTPEEVQKVVANVAGTAPNTRGVVGGQGMTLESYLADPRSAIKIENGQYVFRPGMEGDFVGIDKTGFWDGVGPFALVLGGMALPFAASLGALGAGASAGGTGGAAAGTTAGTTVGTTAARVGAGEFALTGPGMGFGGVGTGGVGLGGSVGLTPGLTTAGGTALSGGAIGTAANTLAGAAGVGSLSSIPTTAQLASMLGATPSLAQQAVEVAKSLGSKPGVTSQAISQAIKASTGLDVSPDMVQTLSKVAAVGLAAGGSGGGGSGGVSTTAASQSAAANDAMALAREQWEWNKARADELLPQQKALIQQQIDIGKTSADRAKSEWEIYNNLYLPAEQQYVQKMTNWDTPDRRTQRIQEAVADVNRGYDAAGGTLERNLARSGVRPGGDGYVQAMGDLTRARAADTAGATSTTRRQVENEGIAGLERITNIGRGRPSTSFAADQLALTAGNSANANTNQNTATTNAGLSSAQGWFNTGVNALNSAGSLQNTAYRNESDNSAGIGKLIGQIFDWGFADGGLVRRGGRAKQPMGGYADGGLVRRAERKLQKHMRPMMNTRMQGYAEGGLVRGPGTETSDSIPAVIDGQEPTALSTGEAVLNAEAVQLVGEEFVERINQVGLERRGRPGRVIEGEARRVM